MITERQKSILKFIVEEYVKTVKPVSSSEICKSLDCSSATVRNEMVILEELGYLEKNHFASGRQPSEKGYKYYVENLMTPKDITGEESFSFGSELPFGNAARQKIKNEGKK